MCSVRANETIAVVFVLPHPRQADAPAHITCRVSLGLDGSETRPYTSSYTGNFTRERGPFDSAQGRRPGEFVFDSLMDWNW